MLNLLPSEQEINDCARFELADALKPAGLVFSLSEIRARFGDAAADEWLARERAEAIRDRDAAKFRKRQHAAIFLRVQLAIRQAHRAAAVMPQRRARATRRRVVAAPARRPARRPNCHGHHGPPDPGDGPAGDLPPIAAFSIEEVRP